MIPMVCGAICEIHSIYTNADLSIDQHFTVNVTFTVHAFVHMIVYGN